MRTHTGQPIIFSDRGYIGKGKFQRRDFRCDDLKESSDFSANRPLFADLGIHEIFTATKSYAPLTIGDLAALAPPLDDTPSAEPVAAT